MSLATAVWDAHATRRVTAAALAVALQGILYWLVLREAVEPIVPPGSTPLEVTVLQTVRRIEPAGPSHNGRQRTRRLHSEPTIEAFSTFEAAKPTPLLQPSNPAGHAPVDWQQAMQGEARAEESRSRHKKLQFGFPRQQPTVPEAPAFGWDYAHTHRLEPLPSGGMLINLTDHCALVVYGLIFPVCKIGKIPANGHLFDHMRDRDDVLRDGLP